MNEAVEIFVPDDVVASLSAAVTGLRGRERVNALVRLAWQLRQRDMRRALTLCDEVESGLPGSPAATDPLLIARLGLVRAESAWLGARPDQARDLAWAAQQGFAAAQDAAGSADACWLLALPGRPEEALSLARLSLDLARQASDVPRQVTALGILADLHAGQSLPQPADPSIPSLALLYLNEALALAERQAGLSLTPEMPQAAAREHARLGQHQRAYELAMKAVAVMQSLHGRNTSKQATAMEIRHQTERAQVKLKHHRALAVAEARRAAVLQQSSATLERLSAVGQEITAHLDGADVVQTLARHIHGLLDAHAFAIYLPDVDGRHLRVAFHIEAGRAAAAVRVALDDAVEPAARCARERRELLLDAGRRLLAPMLVGDRLLGVMALQAPQEQAYGERERQVCRTLCPMPPSHWITHRPMRNCIRPATNWWTRRSSPRWAPWWPAWPMS